MAGSRWVLDMARRAIKRGLKPRETRRSEPLSVAGVGHGTEECKFDCTVPISLARLDGSTSSGTFTAPTIEDSNLPALLGLQSLIDSRAVLDFTDLRVHFCGPGSVGLQLPPGSESYQCVRALSGHLTLPCDESPRGNSGGFSLRSQQITLQASVDSGTPQ